MLGICFGEAQKKYSVYWCNVFHNSQQSAYSCKLFQAKFFNRINDNSVCLKKAKVVATGD